jgi:hypothetical protein
VATVTSSAADSSASACLDIDLEELNAAADSPSA